MRSPRRVGAPRGDRVIVGFLRWNQSRKKTDHPILPGGCPRGGGEAPKSVPVESRFFVSAIEKSSNNIEK